MMKKFIFTSLLLLPIFLSAASIPSYSTNVDGKPALKVYLENLTSESVKKEQEDKFATGVRKKILTTEAFSLGVQGGRYWANQKIKDYIEPFSNKLDLIADFSSVVIPVDDFILLPAVIEEVNYQSKITNNKKTINSVSQSFKITSNPRFVYNVPSWSDYIYFNDKPVEIGHPDLQPQTSEEIKLWKDTVEKGWKKGVEISYESFEVKVSRLIRDLDGMRRYHIMKSKRMVTAPIFDKSRLPIRGNGIEMRIDNIEVTIKVNPKLNSQLQNWESIPRMPDIQAIFPNGLPEFLE
jgi:defect-in-organelle-trafficking protein DotC